MLRDGLAYWDIGKLPDGLSRVAVDPYNFLYNLLLINSYALCMFFIFLLYYICACIKKFKNNVNN